jgi:hypothetical protein
VDIDATVAAVVGLGTAGGRRVGKVWERVWAVEVWVSSRVPSKSKMTTFVLGPMLSASAPFAVQKVKVFYTRQHVKEWARKRGLNAEEAFLYIVLQVHSLRNSSHINPTS